MIGPNTSQVLEPIKAEVVKSDGGEEKWADKVRRGFAGMLFIVMGIGVIALSVFKVNTDWVLLILCLVGVVLAIRGGNIIASDLAKNADRLTVAFVKDIAGAATRVVRGGKKEGEE